MRTQKLFRVIWKVSLGRIIAKKMFQYALKAGKDRMMVMLLFLK